tara:strand:+ start:397 stop:612 length:216 start_codon:yes stop_codon:yes gene_type:complete
VVDSLKSEYEDKIQFLVANLNSREGRMFAEYYNVGRVTLLFFEPDGTKIFSINNELDSQKLRNIFNRVFKF